MSTRSPRLLPLVALIALAAPSQAEEVVVAVPPGPLLIQQAEQENPKFPGGLQPGRAEPKAAAPPRAYRFAWDGYSSLVVVGDGTGVGRPAWVLTYDPKGVFVVGYRARAFRDEQGITHIDARSAMPCGPMAEQWSPDSFAFALDDAVYTLDDQQHGNQGTLQGTVDPQPESGEFERLLMLAQTLLSGGT